MASPPHIIMTTAAALSYSASIREHFGGNAIGTDPFIGPTRLAAIDGNNHLIIDGKLARLLHVNVADLGGPSDLDYMIDEGNVVKCASADLARLIPQTTYNIDISVLTGNAQSCNIIARTKHSHFVVISDSQCNIVATEVETTTLQSPDDVVDNTYEVASPKRKRSSASENQLPSMNSTYLRSTVGSCSTTGWAGISVDQSDSNFSLVRAVHYLSKSVLWMDLTSQTTLRRADTLANPTAISSRVHGNNQHQLAIAEQGMLSVWDSRQSELGGCVVRENVCRSPLYTVLEHGEHDLLCAGADRTVYLYDSRTWKSKLKWRTPCKYEVVKILPAGTQRQQNTNTTGGSASSLFYVAGSDNEVMLCDIFAGNNAQVAPSDPSTADKDSAGAAINHAALPQTSKLRLSHHRGVRAESRWLGIDVVSSGDNDLLVGVCDLGKLYVVKNALNMKLAY